MKKIVFEMLYQATISNASINAPHRCQFAHYKHQEIKAWRFQNPGKPLPEQYDPLVLADDFAPHIKLDAKIQTPVINTVDAKSEKKKRGAYNQRQKRTTPWNNIQC